MGGSGINCKSINWKRPAEPIEPGMADKSLRLSSPFMGKRHESYDNIAEILSKNG